MDEFPVPLLIPLGGMVTGITVIALFLRAEQADARRRSETMRELLAKFETAAELEAFLKTDVARSLIQGEDKVPELPSSQDPALGLMKAGVIVLSIGAGFVLATYTDLRLTTSVLLTLGVGLFVAALLQMRANRSRARRDGTG